VSEGIRRDLACPVKKLRIWMMEAVNRGKLANGVCVCDM